jgi:hypothetical protein
MQMLVKLQLDTMFCVTTSKLAPMYQRIGAERLSEPVRHPVLIDESLNLYRIKTSSFLTGSNMEFDIWKKISEQTMHYLSYHGFLRS